MREQLLSEEAVKLDQAAADLVRKTGRTVEQVLRCDLKANPAWVLYIGVEKRPMTAWLWRKTADKFLVIVEPGFAADPSEVPVFD